MKQKDLAEEYANKAFLKRNVSNPISIHDLCFNVADIDRQTMLARLFDVVLLS